MSFDKVETAQRVRDLIAKQAARVVQQQVSRQLVGRMVSLDPLALKGMVWFPGDEQPVEVSLFSGTLPAKWQSMSLAGGAPQTSVKGLGSEVVVQRINGVLYVTDILTGGAFSANVVTMGSSTVYQLPNSGIDEPVSGLRDAYLGNRVGNSADTAQAVEVYVKSGDLASVYRQSVVFGPFVNMGKFFTVDPEGGMLHIDVIEFGGTAPMKSYELFLSPNLNCYEDGSFGPNHWWRLLPYKAQYMDFTNDVGAASPEFDLDVRIQDNDELADGSNTYYFRITTYGGSSQTWFNVSFRGQGFNRVGGIDSASTFKQWREVDSPLPVGVIGFHNSGNAYVNPSSYRVTDTFMRDPLPTTTTGWGTLPYGLGSDAALIWDTVASPTAVELDVDSTATPHHLRDHYHAYFEFAAVNSQRTCFLKTDASTYLSALDVDLYVDFALEDMSVTQSTRLGWRLRSDNGTNELNIGAQILPNGDVQLRFVKQVSGSFTDIGSTLTVLNGFTTGDVGRLRVRIVGNTVQAKVWLAGPWSAMGTEPRAWQKTETIVDAAIQDAGRIGLWGFITNGATTPVPTRIYYENVIMQLVTPDNVTESYNDAWNSGPWRSGVVRAGADVQRGLVHDGQFSFDGTNIKWTRSIWATGIGPHENVLRWGYSGLTCPTSGDWPRLPNNNLSGEPLAAVAAGMPLPEWHALYVGIPPGVSSSGDDLTPWLFYVRGEKRSVNYDLPEWAVLVASRGPADAPIRLGTGELLKPHTKLWKSDAYNYVASTWLLINWNQEEWDDYAAHSTSSNTSRINILCDGRYDIKGCLSFDPAAQTTRAVMIRKNSAGSAVGGTIILQQNSTGSGTVTDSVGVQFGIETALVAGDYIEIFGFSRTAVAGIAAQHATYLTVKMV